MDAAVAVVGVTLSNALYFNTLPKMRSIFRERALNNFNPMPIVVMLLNACAWVLYGIHVSSWSVSTWLWHAAAAKIFRDWSSGGC